ncbi:MAG TPA: ADOP family duplicated permease, partial [Thermoanaerobaculia bacterium]|nr:ADOP family duplicated permease [Thermoanaerobaculia bacterium]
KRLISSHPNFLDCEARSRSFESIAESRPIAPIVLAQAEPLRVSGSEVSQAFFPLLGIKPELGRLLMPRDFQPGAPPVVVLSHRFWQQQLGGDPQWLDRTVLFDGEPTTIVGVLPANIPLTQPVVIESSEVLRPLRVKPGTMAASRGARFLRVIARLRPGVTLESAATEMRSLAAVLAREHADTNKDSTVLVVPLRTAVVGDVRTSLLILLGAAALVLLAACTNIANLLLVQLSLRKKEFAIRAALGAGRRRIYGQLVAESLGLLVPAALGGLLLTRWAWHLFSSLVPPAVLDLMGVALDARALVVTAVVSLIALTLINFIPWLALPETALAAVLTETRAGAGGDGGNQRTRGLIVAAETALAIVLLLGAGLLIRSFLRLSHVELGFNPQKVLVLDLRLPGKKYEDPALAQLLFDEIFRRIESRPGVRSAALTVNFTLSTGLGPQQGTFLDWQVDFHGTSPGYFSTLGIPLLAGRDLSPEDGAQDRGVVVVNAAAARKLWPGEEAVGKKLFLDWSPPNPREVIGVVGDSRVDGDKAPPRPAVYLPYQQLPYSSVRLVVHTTAAPLLAAADVRREVRSVAADLPIVQLATMEELLAAPIEQPKIYTRILSAFAGVALVLAVVGVYGVTAFAVVARRREIGLRIALGAESRDILRLFVLQGGRWVLLGAVVGTAAAAALARGLAGVLFEISPLDPLTFVAVSSILAGAALWALAMPARKAAAVNPIQALKEG